MGFEEVVVAEDMAYDKGYSAGYYSGVTWLISIMKQYLRANEFEDENPVNGYELLEYVEHKALEKDYEDVI